MFETGAERGRTCLNRHLPYASINCQAGCACAPGLVDDGIACVAPEQCPCYYQNHRYSPNSQVTRDCNTCVCQGGYWQCTDYLCNAECSLIGQSHIITFDDLQVEFDGDCRYVLATNEECGFQTRHSIDRYKFQFENHNKCLQNNFNHDDVTFRIEYVSHTCYGGDHVCHRSIFLKVNQNFFINFEPGFVPQEYGRNWLPKYRCR